MDDFAYLPAEETRGGIILAWDTTVLRIDHIQRDANFITGLVHPMVGEEWWITVVYGPQGDELKTQFLADLVARRVVCPGPWMVLGDFNMILRASEKSNTNLNHNMMNRFRDFVDNNELKELYMHGRRFTWTNERDVPTLTKIDRVLVSWIGSLHGQTIFCRRYPRVSSIMHLCTYLPMRSTGPRKDSGSRHFGSI